MLVADAQGFAHVGTCRSRLIAGFAVKEDVNTCTWRAEDQQLAYSKDLAAIADRRCRIDVRAKEERI